MAIAYVKKEDIEKRNLWEGDKIFFRLLQENRPFFSLKMVYDQDVLTYAALDGVQIR